MYTIDLKNRKKSSLSFTLIMAVSLGIFLQGCNMEEELLDEDVINSPELEEYIIAGADIQKSLAIFNEELSKIDFSKLEVTYDTDGRKVMKFPAGSISVRIEDKINSFNEKKEKLLKKHPQVTAFTLEKSTKYFKECAKSSLNINSKYLELGYNTSRPLLKRGIETTTTHYDAADYLYLYSFLYSWVFNPNYVEIYIIGYSDGSYATHIDSRNDPNNSYITLTKISGVYTFPEGGSYYPVSWIAHSHLSSNTPSQSDWAAKAACPGLDVGIWYDGMIYHY